MAREYTKRMMELTEEGIFDKDILIQDLLGFLSEDDVEEFVRRNDFFGFEDLGFRSSSENDEDRWQEETREASA